MEERWSARLAGVAALLAVIGLLGLSWAVLSTAPMYGYVSEAGAPGAARPVLYQLSIFAVAAALALLAMSLRSLARPVALALFAAAFFAALSGAVPCSAGCPLPPYESPTAGDLIHAAASTLALGLAAVAMLLVLFHDVTPVARVSRIAAFATVPLLLASGLAMLLLGRGLFTGLVERAALVVALCWLASASLVLGQNGRRAARRTPRRSPRPAGRGRRPVRVVRRAVPASRDR
jgi:hypothetical protein